MNEIGSVLKVEDLCVDFSMRQGHVRVLHGINLHVERGETLGIVGESGCGKSMTALAIMRLIPVPPGRISEGRVIAGGRDILKLS